MIGTLDGPRDVRGSDARSAEAARGVKRADPFYLSPEWRKLRLVTLQRDGYRCVVCRRNVSGKGESRVDHIKPRRDHPELALVLSNLRTLCPEHDNQAHREKGRAGGGPRDERFRVRGCDAAGWPIDPAHPWAGGGGSKVQAGREAEPARAASPLNRNNFGSAE